MSSFKELHHSDEPLLLGNVWNVQSARIYEKAGYKALATSSSAVALSLGYEDGEQISFEEYFYVIKRIKESVSIPLSVDLESGYGNTNEIVVSHIIRLLETGVAGINVEDSYVVDGERKLLDRDVFFEKLKDVFSKLKERRAEIFVNIRTDPFLLGIDNALEETLRRVKLFEELKADGVFVPCISNESDIKAVVHSTTLPLNVMAVPELPDFKVLKELGVSRMSSGDFLNRYIYKELERISEDIIDSQSFATLFA
ncbi:isocitrate lyase/PEP mutase family protein [Chryseobacterium pennipullorum]|uniref:Isocitrate lyase/phosphoenolpyruvate mutase family protein n=1 Tax=Chryseobacterium pennipullorum TaxID=2258963 RepID=A0A3D9ATD1_9FLAO|nr:isocitrate lyase/phosphoenolpyruvate mutase family protein [Chryseobacterium pennipullorum]REC44628.1 isocitrate lyase/phosphoenolpyruvate mutase family protein [Chryseobacterium pennipullorum]